jgi:hypothetical protein
MAFGLTLYKDSGRTQVLDAGTTWAGNLIDFGTIDITSGSAHPSADIPFYGKNTGTTSVTNVLGQAAPAALTTVTTGGTYTAGTNIAVGSLINLAVGQTIDVATPIADPGVTAAYSYPLSPTYKAQSAVITAASAGNIQLNISLTCSSLDAIYTSGTLAILGEIQVAPDAAGSAGTYGAQGAETTIAAGPLTATTGTFAGWAKLNAVTGNLENTHKFTIRLRATSS